MPRRASPEVHLAEGECPLGDPVATSRDDLVGGGPLEVARQHRRGVAKFGAGPREINLAEREHCVEEREGAPLAGAQAARFHVLHPLGESHLGAGQAARGKIARQGLGVGG